MAVDTPVLERKTDEKRHAQCAVPSRVDFSALAEEVHNSRIRDTYARLINPDNKIEDVFACAQTEECAQVEETEEVEQFEEAIAESRVQSAQPAQVAQPMFVENARATSALFRADSAINAKKAEQNIAAQATAQISSEEEDEDLRPTPTTIQYQTIGLSAEREAERATEHVTDKKGFVFGKREKIIVAVFVAIVVALVAIIIVNSTVISNLNQEIATVQNSITTVRGALAGVNSSMEEIIYSSITH